MELLIMLALSLHLNIVPFAGRTVVSIEPVPGWKFARFGFDSDYAALGIGKPLHGLVVGRNRWGWYGRLAWNREFVKWGPWLSGTRF